MSDLQEELRTKKRALGQVRLQLARYGISAPVNLIMDEEDLAKEVRSIERELGIEQTPTIQERRSTPAPRRHEPTPEPASAFEQRMADKAQSARHADIEHQYHLLSIYRRNLAIAQAQLKELGAYAPPYVRNSVVDTVEEIKARKAAIRRLGQAVDDLPGDE